MRYRRIDFYFEWMYNRIVLEVNGEFGIVLDIIICIVFGGFDVIVDWFVECVDENFGFFFKVL